MRYVFFLLALLLSLLKESAAEQSQLGYVSVQLRGQFGNQLFQIAAAYAYALDHNLALTVPDLVYKKKYNIPKNAEELFSSKIDSYDIPCSIDLQWKEPSFNYREIPFSNAIELHGFFQSEKYFKHRRDEILALFATPVGLNEKIIEKYPCLVSGSLVVGVQVRDYRKEEPQGWSYPTLNRSYYAQAMSQFPDNALFLVSSNNIQYAKKCTQGLKPNIVYLEDDVSYIEEFYTLVLCRSFIISNSSFGWWAAWLSTAVDKLVIAPDPWFALPLDNKSMTMDLLPEEWEEVQYRSANNHR